MNAKFSIIHKPLKLYSFSHSLHCIQRIHFNCHYYYKYCITLLWLLFYYFFHFIYFKPIEVSFSSFREFSSQFWLTNQVKNSIAYFWVQCKNMVLINRKLRTSPSGNEKKKNSTLAHVESILREPLAMLLMHCLIQSWPTPGLNQLPFCMFICARKCIFAWNKTATDAVASI